MGPTKTRFAYAMVIVAVLYIYVPCTVASLTYRECGTRKFLQINTMSVKNKVVFGKAMYVTGDVHFHKKIPNRSYFALSMYRYVALGLRVSIPCVKGVGSCRYDFCQSVTKFLCGFWPKGRTCRCPVVAGTTLKGKHVVMPLPALPPGLSYLTNGKYLIRVELKGPRGKTLYCVDVDVALG